jgi:DNA-binding CsgD family transcriptional regulator
MFATFGELAKQNRWLQHFRATGLTLRELEILRLIADNRLSNKQIARQLSISMYTVKNHVHNILEKLDAQDRHDAVEIARQRHLLKVVS